MARVRYRHMDIFTGISVDLSIDIYIHGKPSNVAMKDVAK